MAESNRVPDRLPSLTLPDLTGRRVVVTGASSGIGLATAAALAKAGASVVLGVRNLAKGDAVAAQINAATGADVNVEQIELGSLTSIASFAARVATEPVHLLINNAGLSSSDPAATTSEGFDLQVGVNYLGAYALSVGLWPALAQGAGRVVMLGSMMAARGRIDDGLGKPTTSTYRSYSDSKLAAVVFATELRRRCNQAGSPVTAVAAHPGWAQTAIFATAGPPPFINWVGKITGSIQSPADGAQPILLAAIAIDPAPYYGPLHRAGAAGPAGGVPLPAAALADDVGPKVWEISRRLTGYALQP